MIPDINYPRVKLDLPPGGACSFTYVFTFFFWGSGVGSFFSSSSFSFSSSSFSFGSSSFFGSSYCTFLGFFTSGSSHPSFMLEFPPGFCITLMSFLGLVSLSIGLLISV